MTVWVTGAGGLLGRAVTAELARRGLPHVGTGREVDVADAAAVEAFAAATPFTAVINCAADAQVDACEAREAAALRVNGEGPGHVARAARARGAVALHVSTDYVFPGDATAPYREDDPVGPINAYGRTKLAGERAFLAALGDAPGYVVRTSWLFGPGGPCFPATMLRLFAERPEVRVVDDQRGRPTSAPDLAGWLVELLAARPAPGVYHAANAGAVTWWQLALATWDAAATRGRRFDAAITPVPTSAFPTPARRPAWSVLATAKLEAALGHPLRPWSEGLADLVAATLG